MSTVSFPAYEPAAEKAVGMLREASEEKGLGLTPDETNPREFTLEGSAGKTAEFVQGIWREKSLPRFYSVEMINVEGSDYRVRVCYNRSRGPSTSE